MYNEFYGFLEKPFEVTPNPKFLYFTSSHREALDTMVKGIKNRWGFICITGEAGTGKTTLIHSLLTKLDEKVKTVFIFHTLITFKELLTNILQELDVDVTDKSKEVLLKHLVQYLLHRLGTDETLAVIIDEAQNLSKEVMGDIGKLSELETQIAVRLQIVFVGQPEFEDKLNLPGLRQLNQRIGIRRKINTLTEEESKEYIEHRLKLVGSSSSKTFTPKSISMIIGYAKGIPRVINILCDNAFLVGYGLSRKKVDTDIIREVIENMEGPMPQQTIPTRMGKVIKQFPLIPFKKIHFPRRLFYGLLSLIFLGGLVFLIYGFFQQNSLNTRSIESLSSYPAHTETPSISPSPHPVEGQPLKNEEGVAPVERELEPVESPQHVVSPPTSSIPPQTDTLEKVIEVQRGQNISLLAQKYYRMANATVIDFILNVNPDIANAHLITVNQKIRIPRITEESLIIQSPDHTYKIHVGTFWTSNFVRLYRDEPSLKGKEIEIFTRRVSPQETWYQVVIGKFDSKDEILKEIDLLKKKGLLPLFAGSPQ